MSKILKVAAVAALMVTAASASNTAVCKGCHGQNFENKAMGKSKIVKDMTKEEIAKSLKSYKSDKEFGGAMKTLMQGQVAKLSEADIDAIAAEIKK